MQTQLQLIRIFINIGYLAGNCWLAWLFFYALFRTTVWFFWLLAISASLSVVFSVINILLILNTKSLVSHIGEQHFAAIYNVYLVLQFLNFIPYIIGLTYFVLRVCGRRKKKRRIEKPASGQA